MPKSMPDLSRTRAETVKPWKGYLTTTAPLHYRFVLRPTFRAGALATRRVPLTVFRLKALFAGKVFFSALAFRVVAPLAFVFFPTDFGSAPLTAFLTVAIFALASAEKPFVSALAARRISFILAFAAPNSALTTFRPLVMLA